MEQRHGASLSRCLAVDLEVDPGMAAVRHDDQNIHAFNDASVEFIRWFEEHCRARQIFLVENCRSAASIIEASAHVISGAQGRMQQDHPIRINHERETMPAGGRLMQADTVARGRVKLLDVPPGEMAQAAAAVDELVRLSGVEPDRSWTRAGPAPP